MSKENRKAVYDELVKSGDFSKISQRLLDEFGDPTVKPEQWTEDFQGTQGKPKPKPKTKKKGLFKIGKN